jgi:hypothetical protein
MAAEHPLDPRYRAVWETTLRNRRLSAENVAASRFFFDFPNKQPIPKRFDTYAMLCGLPFSPSVQSILESCWQQCLSVLQHPLAYGVSPANRHAEIFLFQRPEEVFSREEVQAGIQVSLPIARETRPFKIVFCHPFLTLDGAIVAPGFDEPAGTIDALRSKLQQTVTACPKKQSQWLHVSLGRILEPIDGKRLRPLLDRMQSLWGELIDEAAVDELLWIWEKQWYMADREVLRHCCLGR